MSTTRAKRLRKSSGTLATVLASAALARVITHFVLHPDVALHFQALRRVTGLSSQSLQHELARLEALGLIDREQDGRLVRYRAARGDARWRTFRDLVARLADPAEVLRVALSELPGVDAAFIYGSYARGTAVHEDSDVDVFVVGEELDDERVRLGLAERTLAVSGLLGREVNVTRYTYDRLARRSAEGRRFVREVLAGDKDWLVGTHPSTSRTTTRPRSKLGAPKRFACWESLSPRSMHGSLPSALTSPLSSHQPLQSARTHGAQGNTCSIVPR